MAAHADDPDLEDEGGEEGEEGEEGEDGDFGSYGGIEGPDSEELFNDLCLKYADRQVVRLHRAAVAGDEAEIRRLVGSGVPVDATLLPRAAFGEVRKCNAMDMSTLDALLPDQTAVEYPEVRQFTTGDSDTPNEIYPTGEYDQPETNLDALFQSPLLRACAVSKPGAVRVLRELGADADFASPCGNNAIKCLLRSEFVDLDTIVPTLRAAASAGNVKPTAAELAALPQDDEERRLQVYPVFLAVTADPVDVEVVRALIELGSPVPQELLDQDLSWLPGDVVGVLKAAGGKG